MDGVVEGAWAIAVDRIVEAADGADGGVQLVWAPCVLVDDLKRRITAGMERLGIVTIEAGRGAPRDLPPAALHRHVTVLCADDEARHAAIAWVRTLAQMSPRRHVVACFIDEEREATRSCDPEGGAAVGVGPRRIAAAAVAARMARAARCLRRGRPRAAELWVASAVAASSRHGDPCRGLESAR